MSPLLCDVCDGFRSATRLGCEKASDTLNGFKVDIDDQVHFTEAYGIDPAYLSIIHATPTQGRLLEQSDQSGNPVAVINEAFARRYFPHVSPLGRHVFLKGPLEIVAVVANHRVLVSREGGVKAWLRPAADTQTVRLMEPSALFIPSAYATGTALGGWSYYLVVSTHPPPESLLPAIRREIGALDPNLAVKNIATFDEWMAAPLAAIRVYAIVLAVFAAIGLCLAGVGVYGVLAHTVGRRVSEIGVRMALGATRRRIVRMVLARTLTLVAVGLSSGLLDPQHRLAASWSERLANVPANATAGRSHLRSACRLPPHG